MESAAPLTAPAATINPHATSKTDTVSAAERAPQVLSAGVPRIPADRVAAADLETAVRANNAFAVALFAELRRARKSENLISSPLSASLALTMTYAGAAGETARGLAKALHFGNAPRVAIFAGQNALSQALQGRAAEALAAARAYHSPEASPQSSDFKLQIVNSIWAQAPYPWEASFLRALTENYGAGLIAVDFQHEHELARQAINTWVSRQTDEKIADLIPTGVIDEATRMVLINALHVKLPWAHPFAVENSNNGSFTHGDGKKSSQRFMNLESRFAYRDDGEAQVIALPLAGWKLTVLVALPRAGLSLARYLRTLRAGAPALTPPERQELVALSLPKASLTSKTFSLREALRALGAPRAFDEARAEFSGMCAHIPDGNNLYITEVLQKTMLEFRETGLEAAAATAVSMGLQPSMLRRSPPSVPIRMIVNRPYVVSVLDATTGAILLLGQIADPSASNTP